MLSLVLTHSIEKYSIYFPFLNYIQIQIDISQLNIKLVTILISLAIKITICILYS